MDEDEDILSLALLWLSHCREEAEYFSKEGEDDTASKWHEDAERAVTIIKQYLAEIDAGGGHG